MTLPSTDDVKYSNFRIIFVSRRLEYPKDMLESAVLVTIDEEIHNKEKDLLKLNLPKLSDYGITEERITALINKITEYETALSEKDSGFASKSALRISLSDLISETNSFLKEDMDLLVEDFKLINSQFYNAYQSARVVWDRGTRRQAEEPVAAAPENK